jgi:hypothetical protein
MWITEQHVSLHITGQHVSLHITLITVLPQLSNCWNT